MEAGMTQFKKPMLDSIHIFNDSAETIILVLLSRALCGYLLLALQNTDPCELRRLSKMRAF